jgi:ribosomal protein L19
MELSYNSYVRLNYRENKNAMQAFSGIVLANEGDELIGR